ncbi:MAG TPA: DUF1003 domain-containing protein [Tepidisphaeraceae bacterium]|nr:DUF1003 domain-containing protein [Tepidisphaeraceae bacterium]
MHTDPLANIPLFASLDPADRAELSAALQTKELKAHQPLFWIGDDGDEFYIVRKGRIVLTIPDDDGRETTLAILEPGAFFGELSLLDGGPRTATARAMTDVELLSLSRFEFIAFLERHPKTNSHIIGVVVTRQREMLEKLRGIKNVNQVVLGEVTAWSRISDKISNVLSSEAFLLTHLTAVIFWIGTNLYLGQERGFDPFPFMALCMMASLEALFLSIFVLISQNRQARKDRIRADLDYQVNIKSHTEVMELHQKLDRLEMLVSKQSKPIEEPVMLADETASH